MRVALTQLLYSVQCPVGLYADPIDSILSYLIRHYRTLIIANIFDVTQVVEFKLPSTNLRESSSNEALTGKSNRRTLTRTKCRPWCNIQPMATTCSTNREVRVHTISLDNSTVVKSSSMKIGNTALLLAIAAHECSSFSLQSVQTKRAPSRVNRIATSNSITRTSTSLFSTVVEQPPAETDEVFGTIVGDTKGAALFLNNVAISRGAEPLLKDINWSVQPNERWGIVGINGAGK